MFRFCRSGDSRSSVPNYSSKNISGIQCAKDTKFPGLFQIFLEFFPKPHGLKQGRYSLSSKDDSEHRPGNNLSIKCQLFFHVIKAKRHALCFCIGHAFFHTIFTLPPAVDAADGFCDREKRPHVTFYDREKRPRVTLFLCDSCLCCCQTCDRYTER